MNIEARKIRFIQEFLKVQSEDVVNHLEKILRKENKISDKECFNPMTTEMLNERIDKSMEDSKKGRLIKASDLKAKMKKWS